MIGRNQNDTPTIDLRWVAAATAVAIGMVALAALLYQLIGILLILFLGIVVAAALQPWHVKLCRYGVPKGLAVLLIYLLFLVGLVLIVVIVAPVLIAQISTFATELPATYAKVRAQLQASGAGPLQLIGQRLPPFERMTSGLTQPSPDLYWGIVGVTSGILGILAYVITVLAVGFYWTMEVPRFERMALSFVPVAQRAHVLNVWHEIESKLGAFIRGQGIAMLAIGVASAIGYELIGLPNVLALAVLAGALEAVPMVGPILAAIPAVIVALPLGLSSALLVIGMSIVIQIAENNLLIPRIMERAVGVSALVGLLAVLAFGTLYGILGVFIAIPMAAVIQVLLESMVINREPVAPIEEIIDSPWRGLRARIWTLRQEARVRLRARETRMGIDPNTADHVIDAVDQQIEQAAERAEQIIAVAREASKPMPAEARAAIVDEIHGATETIEQAVERVESIVAAAEQSVEAPGTVTLPIAELSEATGQIGEAVERVETVVAATAESQQPIEGTERDAIVANLDDATGQIKDAVHDVDTLIVAARER